MALQYPSRPNIPVYESSLAAFLPAFEKGQTERKDANAFDAAAKAFGGNANAPATPAPSPLERLAGMFGGGQQQQPQGPYTRPQPPANAVAAIETAAPSYPPLAPPPGTPIATSDTSNVAAGSNAARAVQYFINKGYQPHQAAGIVGNLMQESGPDLNVAALNPGDGADGSDSIGVAQWNGDRARALQAYAAQIGADVGLLDTQLGFIDHELNTTEGAARAALMQAQDPIQAAAAFAGYERPAGWTADNPYGAHSWGSRAQNAAALAGSDYAPPGSPIGWDAPQGAKPFQMDEATMRTLLASEATRPLAVSLIQAQQETQASQGRFVTEEGPDGSIWQRDTLTGEQKVIREAPAAAKPIEVGGVLLDPNTLQPIFDSRTTGAPELPADVQEYQFYAEQERAAGREPLSVIEYNQALKGNGLTVTTNPDGTTTVQQGGAPKPLTEGQSKDTVFATRAANALPTVDALGESLLSFGENFAGNVPYGNYLQSEDYQVARDAGLEFLASILRKDTGAAVTPSEEALYGRIFLPQPGDKPVTLTMKQQRRALAVEAIKAGMPQQALDNMARALDTAGSPAGDTPAAEAPAPIGEGTIIENDNGDRMVMRNGQWEAI